MKIFDTHAHYNDNKYDIDREQLFKKMKIEGVERITCIGASLKESIGEKELVTDYNRKNVDDIYPKLYYTVGDHPDEIINYKPDTVEGLNHLSSLEKVCFDENGNLSAVAIGEIGLDYFGDEKDENVFKNQVDWFIAEINLAKKLKLPLVIHSRDACKDTYDILKENASDMSGVIHCFSYEKEFAFKYIDMGYYIGIGGVLTFKNARKLIEVVNDIPLSSIVVETDCPYLSPTPHRGERNESSYIRYIIHEIAHIKNMTEDEVSETTFANANKLYNLH